MVNTITVGSIYECNLLDQYAKTVSAYDPTWRHTVNGCKILRILQDMYRFNISYVREDPEMNLTKSNDTSYIDVYIRPMNFRPEFLDFMHPTHVAYAWRYGFLLRRPETSTFLQSFYSQPFSRPVWNCLYAMAVFVSVLFYILKKWELGIAGGLDTSFGYEVLMVVGAYCQHIPPMDPILPSRRIAYFIFFLFTYLVYTFYTSNLLSNLVNEEDQVFGLEMLSQSDITIVIPDYINPLMMASVSTYNHNYSIIAEKWDTMESMTAMQCLERVRNRTGALLSDYASIIPLIHKTFDSAETCSLFEIDLFSRIEKYFFATKGFRYLEKLKIGMMRASETGILKRLLQQTSEEPHCSANHFVNTGLSQILTPLITMMCTYLFCVIILIGEIIYYKRTHVYPYVN